jgi:hypothetical protein
LNQMKRQIVLTRKTRSLNLRKQISEFNQLTFFFKILRFKILC